ncbi:MAG: zinc-dependent metalloprotease [Woeseiaceae bacterium]|nr:zinc-dependent metalloprotease [Woeseiaceae bacterium]
MAERSIAVLLLCALIAGCGGANEAGTRQSTNDYESIPGFVPMYWDNAGGRLYVKVDAFDTPFIYQSSLPRGVGSNNLGLDRGQLGDTKLVRFVRSGPRVLLIEDNLGFRAVSDDADEKQAVDESFARSVIWGFNVASEAGGAVLIDGTDFFLRDAHGLSASLAASAEGAYSVDGSRSAIYLPRTKGFPDNTEVEAVITYVGSPTGPHLQTVVPDPTSVTVHLHHSFIRLPEDGYTPLPYDPRAGVIGFNYGSPGFVDYASEIGTPLFTNYGRRHRLEKVNPDAEVSEAVEPIVYYVDRGAPEPVRSALIEGASWWNEAFEAAGYRDAFRVELLPEGADPMDVRYNVIQWVHRSTRGWSYGASVLDPRTGEILKGHVTLGSLRVRQDYMIAEGLLAPYKDDSVPPEMLEMSLARIRQLSAHEVGHTLGFEHNFAASTQDRASVMDYPFPLIKFAEDGSIDLSDAYDVGIGEWDTRTVIYAYQDFPDGTDEAAARAAIMAQTIAQGYRYAGDETARGVGAAHPGGNLWDNGADAINELEHLLAVRSYALERFSDDNIRRGQPNATLEEVLVPIYLLHRFQLHAVGKLVGGLDFAYSMRGDGQPQPRPVSADRQRVAIAALLTTLDPAMLRLPDGLAERIPPRPPGHPRTREMFASATGAVFDPLAPAAAAAALTLEVLLDPQRAARMNRGGSPGFDELVNELLQVTWFPSPLTQMEFDALQMQTNMLVVDGLLRLAIDEAADPSVRAVAHSAVMQIRARTERTARLERDVYSFLQLVGYKIDRVLDDPETLDATAPPVVVPPGSPIGAASGDGAGWIQ